MSPSRTRILSSSFISVFPYVWCMRDNQENLIQFSSNFNPDIIELQIQWHELFPTAQPDCLFLCHLDKSLTLKLKASNLLYYNLLSPSTYFLFSLCLWNTEILNDHCFRHFKNYWLRLYLSAVIQNYPTVFLRILCHLSLYYICILARGLYFSIW